MSYSPDRFCECGCGQTITIRPFHKYSGVPKYIRGHGSRVNEPPNKLPREPRYCGCGCGQKFICRVNSKKSYLWGHHRRGKNHTEETRRKMSESQKGTKFSKSTLEKMSKAKKGRKMSEEEKQKRRGKTHKNPNCVCVACKAKKGCSGGANHPNWKGGLSFLPYPPSWTLTLKRSIRERDNHICQLCGKTKKEEGRELNVHHIDYDKENLNPKNLITLCLRCNVKVNYGRKNWTKSFQLKLKLTA